jgi:putative addiction module component (TIGR02574 family)
MAQTVEEIIAAALELTEEERHVVVEELLATERESYDTEWIAEIDRRVADYQTGKVEGIPAEEVFRELRAALKK